MFSSNIQRAAVVVAAYALVVPVTYAVAWILAAISRSVNVHMARKANLVITEFSPPAGLSACEIGYLIDKTFDDNELKAQLLTMAQKEIIKLDVRQPDWLIERLDSKKATTQIEEVILVRLADTDHLSRIASGTSEVSGLQREFEAAVLGDLASKGLVMAYGTAIFSNLQRITALVLSFGLLLITLSLPLRWVFEVSHSTGQLSGYAGLENFTVNLMLFPLYITLWTTLYYFSNLISYAFYRGAGLLIGSTVKLRKLMPELFGFKEYLRVVELPRHDLTVDQKSIMAPYVVALWPRD